MKFVGKNMKSKKAMKNLIFRYSIALLLAGIGQNISAFDTRLVEFPIDRYFGKMADLNCTPEVANKIAAQDHESTLMAAEATSFAQALLALQNCRLQTLNPDYVAIQNADLKSLKTSYESIAADQGKASEAQSLERQIELKTKLVNTLNDQMTKELANSKTIQIYVDSVTKYCAEPLGLALNSLSSPSPTNNDSIGLIARYPTVPESFQIRVKTIIKEKIQKECYSDELQKLVPTDETLIRETVTRRYSNVWAREYPYELVTAPQEPSEPPLPTRMVRCSHIKGK